MGKPITSRISPEVLAHDSTSYSVQIPITQFKRVAEFLHDEDGDFQAECQFTPWEKHTKVSGQWQANVRLLCQRCLQPMSYTLSAAFQLICVESEAQANELADELDPVIMDEHRQIHVVDLFEDDIILQMPSVARHEGDETCSAGKMEYGKLPENIETKKPNPFEALKDLNLKN